MRYAWIGSWFVTRRGLCTLRLISLEHVRVDLVGGGGGVDASAPSFLPQKKK